MRADYTLHEISSVTDWTRLGKKWKLNARPRKGKLHFVSRAWSSWWPLSLQRRFQQTQDDASYTVLALLPTLSEQILRTMDVEALTDELQSRAKSRNSVQSPPLPPNRLQPTRGDQTSFILTSDPAHSNISLCAREEDRLVGDSLHQSVSRLMFNRQRAQLVSHLLFHQPLPIRLIWRASPKSGTRWNYWVTIFASSKKPYPNNLDSIYPNIDDALFDYAAVSSDNAAVDFLIQVKVRCCCSCTRTRRTRSGTAGIRTNDLESCIWKFWLRSCSRCTSRNAIEWWYHRSGRRR